MTNRNDIQVKREVSCPYCLSDVHSRFELSAVARDAQSEQSVPSTLSCRSLP